MVFAVELTRDFNLFPALLAGSAAALAVTVLLMKRSILTEKLARRGHHITREYSIDPFEFARVQDVMDRDVPSVADRMTLEEYADRIAGGDSALGRRQATLLLDKRGRLSGIITRGDVVRALRTEGAEGMTVADAGSKDLVVTYPDEPLHAALTKMLNRDIGRLPVVDHADSTRVVGYLGRAAILSARLRQHHEENVRQKG
jgi:CBS domain-containing protein